MIKNNIYSNYTPNNRTSQPDDPDEDHTDI